MARGAASRDSSRNRGFVIDSILTAMLLALGHAFVKMSCLGSIFEQQTREAFLELEAVEERAILIVLEVDVKLLIPKNTTLSLYIYKFQIETLADKIIGENNRTGQPCVLPLARVRIRYVETGNSLVDDFVRDLGDDPLDFLFVRVLENAGRQQRVREHGGR